MKYLFIDTNIYIQCCLLELEGDSLDTLNKLGELLEKQQVKLLLPEVVELEFHKVLKNKFDELNKKIGSIKSSINKDGELDKKIKLDLISKLTECIDDRKKNTERVKEKMEEVFKNEKFVIKKDLVIKEKNLVNAYKAFLSGEKPYKNKFGTIQPDCVIIETLVSYFENIADYELFFCSINKWDFAKNPDSKNNLAIHNDISKKFKHIEYYENLFELLNNKFKGDYSKDSIDKLKEKEKEIYDQGIIGSVNDLTGCDSLNPSLISPLARLSLSGNVKTCVCCGAIIDDGFGIAFFDKCENCRNELSAGYNCGKCGRHFHRSIASIYPLFNGQCDECQNKF